MKFRNNFLRSIVPAAAFLAAAVGAPASAQNWGPGFSPPDHGGRIPPQHVEEMVRSMGFQPVAEPRTRGPLWVTHAVDREGQQVRVLIDSFSGRVIDVLRRPLPPSRVAVVPPPNFPSNGAMSDYEEGPDYDYRNMPERRPADWPPSRPNAQQQGPQVIPFGSRSNSPVPIPPRESTAKKSKDKDKKKEAALPSEKNKENDKAPPAKSPPIDAQKKDTPRSAETPTFVPNEHQKRQMETTGSIPPAQSLEMRKSESSGATPPVQPPF